MGKALSTLRALYYVVVIAGITLFLLDIYYTKGGWQASLAGRPQVSFEGSRLRIDFTLDIYNPSHSDVKAKLVWYTIYLDGEYVGEGFKPYLTLHPGHNKVKLYVTIDLLHLPCTVAEALSKGRVTVEVKGYATVTLMLFGKIGYKDVTVPIDAKPYEVTVSLSPAAKQALKGVAMLCKLVESGTVGGGGTGIPMP